MHPMIKAFITVAPFLNQAMAEDAAVGITDTEKFVGYVPGKTIDVGVKIGMPIGDDAISTAMKENRTIQLLVSEEVYGIPFLATGTPIRDEQGRVVGGFGYAVNITEKVEMEKKMESIAANLAAAMQEMSANVQQVSSNTLELSNYFADLAQNSQATNELLKNIDGILKFVKNVGNKTNLIGLNAAIEAARAGEAGRSFKIVANEIRDLAVRSKQSVEEITDYLHDIQVQIEGIVDSVKENESFIQEQSASMQEIAAGIQELNAMADELQQTSEKILGTGNKNI